MPVVAEHPAILEVVTPQISVNASLVIALDKAAENFKVEEITIERIEDIHGSIYSINISPNHLPIDFCEANYELLQSTVNKVTKLLIARLFDFIKVRLPLHRSDLMRNRQYVWESLRRKIKQMACFMIISSHITSFDDIDYMTKDDSLLQSSVIFVKISDAVKHNDMDRCYLVLDKKWNLII